MADRLGEDSTGGKKPNFTDEQRQDAIRELVPLKNIMEAANGVYRSALKRWKGMGANTAALTKIISERRLDPAEVTAQLREEVRLRAISGRYPTIQTDLMSMFEAAPIDVSDKAQAEMNESRVEDDGYFAGYAGHKIETCPAEYVAGSPFNVAWRRGWSRGQGALATKTFAGGGESAPKGKKNGASRGATQASPRRGRRAAAATAETPASPPAE